MKKLYNFLSQRLATIIEASWPGFYTKKIQAKRRRNSILHYPPERVVGEVADVKVSICDNDHNLVSRIVTAYRASIKTPVGSKNSIWLKEFEALNNDTHELLAKGDHGPITNLLPNLI